VKVERLVGSQLIKKIRIVISALESRRFINHSGHWTVIYVTSAHHRLELDGKAVDSVFIPELSNPRELPVRFSIERLL
jgi:hypothetical protein